MLFAKWQHHLRFCSGFPYAPLKAMVTKISKWSRIQDSFRITPKIESLVVCAISDIPSKFQKNPSVAFWIILRTHRQTNKVWQKHNLLSGGNNLRTFLRIPIIIVITLPLYMRNIQPQLSLHCLPGLDVSVNWPISWSCISVAYDCIQQYAAMQYVRLIDSTRRGIIARPPVRAYMYVNASSVFRASPPARRCRYPSSFQSGAQQTSMADPRERADV